MLFETFSTKGATYIESNDDLRMDLAELFKEVLSAPGKNVLREYLLNNGTRLEGAFDRLINDYIEINDNGGDDHSFSIIDIKRIINPEAKKLKIKEWVKEL